MPASLRIAIAASECTPFAKSGGLADVSAALARALWKRGHDVRLFVPYYRSIDASGLETEDGLAPFRLEFPDLSVALETRKAPLEGAVNPDGEPLMVEFVNAPDLFGRDSFYTDDPDEPVRWAAFSRAVLEACQRTAWRPDVVHVNDWHTGLLPLYLRTHYAWDELFRDTRTLLSIHNLGYQGVFPASAVEAVGLGDARKYFDQDRLADGAVGFLETGLTHASWLSTVSETYAREIQTAEHGMGLDELLRRRADHLVGIVNGIDAGEWDPCTDVHLPAHYDADDLAGKAACRAALLEEMEVAPDPSGPVLGIVSRMTGQKGFELLPDILPVLLQSEDVRLVVLGSGEETHERYFRWLREKLPHRVGLFVGYDEGLSHRVEAGSDVFLMPSRYEPCGLNQMYSMRYGTLPLVRATGGLADTVERYDPDAGKGTGFVFYEFTSEALHDTLRHVLDVWRDRDAWRAMQDRGMRQDFSWDGQVQRYEDLYAAVMAEMQSA
ncbi:MAG: glycogen synthase [Planctomycetota bacterium]